MDLKFQYKKQEVVNYQQNVQQTCESKLSNLKITETLNLLHGSTVSFVIEICDGS